MTASETRKTFATTVLGESVLRLHSLTGYEALSEPFRFSLTLLSDSRLHQPIDQAALLGTVVKVTVDQDYTAASGMPEHPARHFNGYVSEGAGENIFVIYDGVVYTPGAASSILLGITRDCALTLLRDLGYEVRYEPIARDLLYIADEIFFTGTAAEITPVRSVDRIPVGTGSRGPITQAVQEEFFAITSGEKPDRYGWLTHVRQTEPGD